MIYALISNLHIKLANNYHDNAGAFLSFQNTNVYWSGICLLLGNYRPYNCYASAFTAACTFRLLHNKS